MPLQDQASASLRFSFPSAFANARPAFLVQGSQPCHSSRFSVRRSCGFGRHSSSSAAELFRAGDRGTELLDHASPASFSVAFRYRFRVVLIWSTYRFASVKDAD
jgi:hypothetical protein